MDWLPNSFRNGSDLTVAALVWRLGWSLVLGLVVCGVYRWKRRAQAAPRNFPATLVLLSILIAMVTQVIGDNVARAFSLVGALAIVRFRTVVQDTQDTAFVIFAVVVGMAVGANYLLVALVGTGFVALAVLLMNPETPRSGWLNQPCTLELRLAASSDPNAIVPGLFDRFFARYESIGVGTARQGASIDLKYNVWFRPEVSPNDFVAELKKIEPVQRVQLDRGIERPTT